MEKEHQVHHSEHRKYRGEKLVNTYADGHIREYDSSDPRLVVDLINDNKWIGKIIFDKNPIFDRYTLSDLDTIEIIKGHHKARLVIQVGDGVNDENGVSEHQIHSPKGFLGYAYGDKLDFYLASLLYNDPEIAEKAEGHGSFDETVERYLEEQFGISGLFKKS